MPPTDVNQSGWGVRSGVGVRSGGGCYPIIEVIVKMQKMSGGQVGGGGAGGRVDVNQQLKLL